MTPARRSGNASPAYVDQVTMMLIVGGTDDVGLLDLDALPDLPNFEEEAAPVGGTQTDSLGASVKVREVSLPELPGGDADDLLPPPSPARSPTVAWASSSGPGSGSAASSSSAPSAPPAPTPSRGPAWTRSSRRTRCWAPSSS
ncbi:unnamed protein product [Prorocentrum cordatum]|uniref:Subtilisin n=1 Tax=Prorocentrum cordatum TaxID=2364126 RepID=A0ABN9VMP2_9DINO|nr:unnamed protein product [Polarella glacialis]